MALAVMLPFLARFGVNPSVHAWDQTGTSFLVLAGIVLSHVLIKRFSRYPSQDPFSTVFPAVTVAFLTLLFLITLGHLDYSRALLFMGYVMTLAWYGFVGIMRETLLKPRLAVVPVGSGRSLLHLDHAQWMTLQEPSNTVLPRGLDGVVVDLNAQLDKSWHEFIIFCAAQGMPIFDSTRTREFMTGEVELSRAGDIGLDALHPQRSYIFMKAVADFMLALFLLPLVLLVLGATGILIKMDSDGPVFFKQKRVGFRGNVFECYKLRSMRVGAQAAGPSFTAAGDPRITRVGRFIRKYRLDELPQIFNILKGEMSWIGPRPEAVDLSESYANGIPHYAFRHAVKPGITGWAAIRQGNVAEVEAATCKLRHDFFYIKNISASLDVFIAVKTLWIVLTGFGSK
ncbi:sugar transferase [Aestuariivirga sp.]|uniref:sugar transferase n=1 Tax=Aestuariivirga sp. TaxID=2650926 RepID=UPI003BAC6CF9